MMDTFGLGPLPQGWECKIETRIGRLYFINHSNHSTTWEDPRLIGILPPPYNIAIQQASGYYFEDISGSRWSSPVPSGKFQRKGSSPRISSSPRIAPSPPALTPRKKRSNSQVLVLESTKQPPTLLQTDPNQKVTITDIIESSNKFAEDQAAISGESDQQNKENERPPSAKSFASSSYCGVPANYLTSLDTEAAYRTVCAIFPTASEPHVRHLFHKYHNRATLVISALQVSKYPMATEMGLEISPKNLPSGVGTDNELYSNADSKSIGISSPHKHGSFTGESPARTGTATPVSTRYRSSLGSLHLGDWGSPLLSLHPQLHAVKAEGKFKSPKMKLKYMKGIFPAADEDFLLDVLTSCDNNVQKASAKLMSKGFSKTPPAKPARHKWLEIKSMIERRNRVIDQHKFANQYFFAQPPEIPPESPFPTPLMKSVRPHITLEEKLEYRNKLKDKFPKLPERFVAWAFEAANGDFSKTERLLLEVGPQTPEEFKPFISKQGQDSQTSADAVKLEFPEKKRQSLGERVTFAGDTTDSAYFEADSKPKKKSFLSNIFRTKSTETSAKGANPNLAKGPNPNLRQTKINQSRGPAPSLSKGANASLRQGPQSRAQGRNPSLAKGSMWANMKSFQVTVEG